MDLGRFDLSESLQLFGLALVIRFSRGCGSAGLGDWIARPGGTSPSRTGVAAGNWCGVAAAYQDTSKISPDGGMVQNGAKWCKLMFMSTTERAVRQSVSLPNLIARRVRSLAKSQKTSTNRVLVDLIEEGLKSKEAQKQRFFELADALSNSVDDRERERIKKELAQLTFGE
jgi:hypothetical protein